ncbi:hypothetical protein [Actinomycetospora atypica]|uniref:Uncharacterized protein n=1 Tax=Actinomycetospora atypica TaxID=1290095 RepID=A0ABV9YGW7_9PSEU
MDKTEQADDALGAAPEPGQVEAYAAFRAAWRALGRPEIDREELELSDGQLRVRVRAHQREAAWAPRYVGNELPGTRQAATRAQQDAQLRRAEAAAAAEDAERERLAAEADQAAALAETLETRTGELVELDDARSGWLAHTAGTRAAAERASAELAARHADTTPDRSVTAAEWLEAHLVEQVEDEAQRDIVDTDVLDGTRDAAPLEDADGENAPVSNLPDVREVAQAEPRVTGEDDVRVPDVDETAAAIERAHRALAEIQARDELDAAEEAAHQADQLSRWQTEDALAEDDYDGNDLDEPLEGELALTEV